MTVVLREVEQSGPEDSGPVSIDAILEKASEYVHGPRRAGALRLVREAYDFAGKCHADQTRLSGDLFITHPTAVAALLTEIRMDEAGLAAALLHDVIEDSGCEIETLQEKFGHEVADLVDGVTKLSQLKLANLEEAQAYSLRKMFLAMARDIRVVLVKLADRLHNVRTAQYLPDGKREEFCQETLEIFAPLAGRLGIWWWKWQLEDGAFRFLDPSRYRWLANSLDARRQERERRVSLLMAQLKEELEKTGVDAEISGRAKHIYSIHKKMRAKQIEFDQVHDLIAVRVLVQDIEGCYRALAVVHSLWRAVPGEFDDYISSPKQNRYRSLHTAVMGPGGMPFEVQIRTEEMHREAEYGVAAHWRYKEGHLAQDEFDLKLAWIRQLLQWQEDLDSAAPLVDILKVDIFGDQVFVFTPNGDVVDLPKDATPLDFAYRIHTEIGHHCIGTKVNGRLVPLEYELKNGDRVEILTSKGSRGPSRDWLTIVRTGHAREKVRQWFKRQEKAENEEYGRLILDNELRRLGQVGLSKLAPAALAAVAERLSFADVSGLLAAIGYGAVTPTQVINRLGLEAAGHEPEPPGPAEAASAEAGIADLVTPRVDVMGTGDLFTRLANCCNPLPGDAIVGFITRGRGVTVHRADCSNVVKSSEPERLVDVSWGGLSLENAAGLRSRTAACCSPVPGANVVGERLDGEVLVHAAACSRLADGKAPRVEAWWGAKQVSKVPVVIRLSATDREGLLRDVAGVVAEEGYSISSADVATTDDGMATLTVSLALANITQLTRLLNRLQSIRNVISARRVVLQGKRR